MEADWDEFPAIELYAYQPPRPAGQDAPTTQLVHWEQGAVTRPLPPLDAALKLAAIQRRGQRVLRAWVVGSVVLGMLLVAFVFTSSITVCVFHPPPVPLTAIAAHK